MKLLYQESNRYLIDRRLVVKAFCPGENDNCSLPVIVLLEEYEGYESKIGVTFHCKEWICQPDSSIIREAIQLFDSKLKELGAI